MATQIAEQIRVGSIDELKAGGSRVVTGGGHAIAVFHHDGRVYAVDNRCPHIGLSPGPGQRQGWHPHLPLGTTPASTWPAAAPSTPSPTTCAASR